MREEYYQVQAFQTAWEACSLKFPTLIEAMDYRSKLQSTIPHISLRIIKIKKECIIVPFNGDI